MKKTIITGLLFSLLGFAHAGNWQTYARHNGINQLDTESVRDVNGLRHYNTRGGYTEATLVPTKAVVDCANKKRGDTADQLRDIYPNTKYSEELDIACGISISGATAQSAPVSRERWKLYVSASNTIQFNMYYGDGTADKSFREIIWLTNYTKINGGALSRKMTEVLNCKGGNSIITKDDYFSESFGEGRQVYNTAKSSVDLRPGNFAREDKATLQAICADNNYSQQSGLSRQWDIAVADAGRADTAGQAWTQLRCTGKHTQEAKGVHLGHSDNSKLDFAYHNVESKMAVRLNAVYRELYVSEDTTGFSKNYYNKSKSQVFGSYTQEGNGVAHTTNYDLNKNTIKVLFRIGGVSTNYTGTCTPGTWLFK